MCYTHSVGVLAVLLIPAEETPRRENVQVSPLCSERVTCAITVKAPTFSPALHASLACTSSIVWCACLVLPSGIG